jgi:hypothetical protein
MDPYTVAFGTGFETRVFWGVGDACPDPNSVASVALNEDFGNFTNLGGSNWPNPDETYASGYDVDNYTFQDTIRASTDGTYNPVPTYTSSSSPSDLPHTLKFAAQTWRLGTQTTGNGWPVFTGQIQYFRDHGDSH